MAIQDPVCYDLRGETTNECAIVGTSRCTSRNGRLILCSLCIFRCHVVMDRCSMTPEAVFSFHERLDFSQQGEPAEQSLGLSLSPSAIDGAIVGGAEDCEYVPKARVPFAMTSSFASRITSQ